MPLGCSFSVSDLQYYMFHNFFRNGIKKKEENSNKHKILLLKIGVLTILKIKNYQDLSNLVSLSIGFIIFFFNLCMKAAKNEIIFNIEYLGLHIIQIKYIDLTFR